jgi:hypothetical protein
VEKHEPIERKEWPKDILKLPGSCLNGRKKFIEII